MNTLYDKKESDRILGTFGFFSTQNKGTVVSKGKYLGGIKIYDELIQSNKYDLQNADINFETRPNGILIYIINGFDYLRFPILYSDINYWNIESQTRIASKKSKSIVGRALVGGLLLGPVGAVVGGMTGLKDKEVIKSVDGIDNILTISVTGINGNEDILLFSVTDKNKEIISSFFKNILDEKYKEFNEESDTTAKINDKPDTIDKLMKLKELYDSGLLSKEEFDVQKQKLLDQ